MSNLEYERILDEICLTETMPIDKIDEICNFAHKQIYSALASIDGTRKDRQAQRDHEIFGYRHDDVTEFNAEWQTYMEENWQNFEQAC